ncbi:hypothetical protein HOLleu_09515 [Holothuria leucospilota]|uniref:Uncharacterized protein n=1 Tax=Holothuria leucospilota TaxID=206669 RepID=A0A9Q1CBL8_HOLLE|nr:hypothetical protein HOLleu_09515 [Holothuria leucospilota]
MCTHNYNQAQYICTCTHNVVLTLEVYVQVLIKEMCTHNYNQVHYICTFTMMLYSHWKPMY